MKQRGGFSLLELAIVLVIIALIVAAIFSARSMIRQSQIQAAIGEAQMFASATRNFKTKYLALPGDFAGATAIWGEVSGGCHIGSATGTQTCNGNGNGFLSIDGSGYEHIKAWRHLGLSGFINEDHTGNTSGSSVCNMDIKAGANAPASKLKGAMWNIGHSVSGTVYDGGVEGTQFCAMNVCTTSATLFTLWLGGSLQDDNAQAESCSKSQIPALSGAEAYEIDVKYDNKRATSGKIRMQYNNLATYQSCEDASGPGGYRTSATGMNCSIVFLIEP